MTTTDGSVRMAKVLVDVYNRYGIDAVIQTAIEVLYNSGTAGNSAGLINGEICEVVLMLITKDYIKSRRVLAECYQSLVLPDPKSGDMSRRLENDMVLLSEGFLATAECKSYRGNLVIRDECKITRKNGCGADVFKQCQSHLRSLKQIAEVGALSGVGAKPPLVSFCFIFSDGTIKDSRDEYYRRQLPIVTVKNIYGFYDNLFAKLGTRKAYDFKKMRDLLGKFNCSRSEHEAHRAYVGY